MSNHANPAPLGPSGRAWPLRMAAALALFLLLQAAIAGEAAKSAAPKEAKESAAAVQEEEPAAPAEGARRKQPETLLEFALAGGWAMLPLLICSVLWVTFLIERLTALRKGKVVPSSLTTAIRALIAAKPVDRERVRAVLDAHPSATANVLRAAIDRFDASQEVIEKAVNNVAQREIYRLRRNIWVFAVLSTITPLLGLLGTVIGLVQAFREVALSGLGAGATLAPGIYEALVCTVGGLAVAIPSFAAYYAFMALVDYYVNEFDGLAVDLVDARPSTLAAP
jgi:biopolymer transport protein ExbB